MTGGAGAGGFKGEKENLPLAFIKRGRQERIGKGKKEGGGEQRHTYFSNRWKRKETDCRGRRSCKEYFSQATLQTVDSYDRQMVMNLCD